MDPVQEDAIAPAIRQEIDARLTAVEQEHDVRLLLAVESGSRACGLSVARQRL